MALTLQFTEKGLAECLAAKNRGLRAEIAFMAFGSASYTPTKNQTKLSQEKERIDIADYQDGVKNLRMAGVFRGALEYPIGEIGIYLSTGTLLGVYSQPGKILGYRTPTVKVVQWFTLNIEALPTASVTVIVGAESLNLILDNEFIANCVGFIVAGTTVIKNSHWNMQLSERIRKLENPL